MEKQLIVCLFTFVLGIMSSPAFSQDSDGDGVPDSVDNCPNHYNPSQTDSYPPQGNNIGDACDCEGNFNCDEDCGVDSLDVALFIADTGRNTFNNPCTIENPCNGDFNCDGSVASDDVTLFLPDTGR